MRGQIPLCTGQGETPPPGKMLTFSLFFGWLRMVHIKADEQQTRYEEGITSAEMLRLWKEQTGSKTLPTWLVICLSITWNCIPAGFALGINLVWSFGLACVVAIAEALKLS